MLGWLRLLEQWFTAYREKQREARLCTRELWVPRRTYRPLTLRLPLIGYVSGEVIGNQLLNSGLQWFWCCFWKARSPWDYPLKRLTPQTLSEFAEDCVREDVDEFLYLLDVYGWVPEGVVEENHLFLAQELSRFWEGGSTGLQVVMQRLDDEPEECTYVSLPQSGEQRDERVSRLLREWEIDEQFSGFRVFRRELYVLKYSVLHYRDLIGGKYK